MDLLSEALYHKHRILAVTILGHGDSSIPDKPITLPEHADLMYQCMKKLDFMPCILIGHSIGGRISMIIASEHPSEIRGLILVDIVPPDPAAHPWSQQTPEPFKNTTEALNFLKLRYPNFTSEYIDNRLKYGFTIQTDGSLKMKPAGNANMTSYDTDLWPFVERIRVPTLLVSGSESNIAKPDKIERMKKSIPRFEVVIIGGAGHMVPQEKPKEFEDAVTIFIKRVE